MLKNFKKNLILIISIFIVNSYDSRKVKATKYIGYLIIVVALNIIVGKNITHIGFPWYSNVSIILLLNINIILVLVLLLLIFRNIVKILSEKKGSLKTKLFLFSIVVTVLPVSIIFIYASQLINNSIDKWFSSQVDTIVNHSGRLVQDVRSDKIQELKKHLRIFSYFSDNNNALVKNDLICSYVYNGIYNDIIRFDKNFNIDLKCNSNSGNSFLVDTLNNNKNRFETTDYLSGYIMSNNNYYWGGYFPKDNKTYGFMVLKIMDNNIRDQIDSIYKSFDTYSQNMYYIHPIRNSSLLQLLQISLLISFSSVWISLIFARTITKPIDELAKASERISEGKFDVFVKETAGGEVGELIKAFNTMSSEILNHMSELNNKNIILSDMYDQIVNDNMYIDAIFKNVDSAIILYSNELLIMKLNIKAELLIAEYTKEYNEFLKNRITDFMQSDLLELTENIEFQKQDEGKIFSITLNKLELSQEKQILAMFNDVTDVVDTQKIALWKEIATKIAHEVKNPLTPIKLMAERVKRKNSKNADINTRNIINDCMDIIISESDNLKELIEEFNLYARLPKANKEKINLEELLNDILLTYSKSYTSINFNLICDNTIEINCDRNQIRRAIANLLSNACIIINSNKKEDGKIEIRVENINNEVVINVIDNGPGIEESFLPNLFKPYFTQRQGGTGLGLAIVKKIVEEHSGHVSGRNADENYNINNNNEDISGAIFSIALPFIENRA